MLSIAKIGSASSQAASSGDYANYLGAAKPAPDHAAYLEYASAHDIDAPAPFWACKGPELLGLDAGAEAEHIERLARGFHPLTGEPLVKGAGDKHVMGLDMTFSAPKDFSAVFAGADAATRSALVECLQGAARDALAYAEQAAVTRHGHAGLDKQFAEAAVAFCATHMASRALQPQLHVHAMFLNVGKRRGVDEWSALEHRPQFDRKMATGALFRVALADRVRALGFGIVPDGPYFAIQGITQEQRDALSMRSQEIDQLLREAGLEGAGPKARQAAALATRSRKAEPPLPELLESFERQAEAIGITPDAVSRMRSMGRLQSEFAIDREALLRDLVASQSCATSQEALSLICERAMGRLSAAECLAELDAFMAHENVVHLGRTEALSAVFTSRATLDMEAAIDRRFEAGKADRSHSVDPALIDREFDRLESELRAKLGVEVSLSQQRAAARHIACAPGSGALVVGWAGTGKTTMLRAAAAAMRGSGLEVVGCCQSAAAAQNLAREAGIPSRTIASLMLSIRQDRARLGPRSLVVLDEAGMVGSREFGDLQEAVLAAGGKLVCVGDPKQLQPIEAGGVFASLIRIHGAAEISSIQRQRTDFEPLLKWLESGQARAGGIDREKADALRGMPEEARLAALDALCAAEPKLARGFQRWKSRYDFEWMREAVEKLATGNATEALELMDSKGRVKLSHGREEAFDALISAWAADKTPLPRKAIVAGTRADVAELNARARAVLIERGIVDDAKGIEVEITHRDESTAMRRFAPGDRVVFTKNDRNLGVTNGVSGTVAAIEARMFETVLVVELDDANARGETSARIPASFGWLDHALCLTNYKSQGRTYDSAHVMAGMLDREWAYVACSRSRFATTLYADASSLGLVDIESHRSSGLAPKSRADALDALASRMRRSRAKCTTLDYDDALDIRPEQELHGSDISRPAPALGARMVSAARRLMASLTAKRARVDEHGHGPGHGRGGALAREQEREHEQERTR